MSSSSSSSSRTSSSSTSSRTSSSSTSSSSTTTTTSSSDNLSTQDHHHQSSNSRTKRRRRRRRRRRTPPSNIDYHHQEPFIPSSIDPSTTIPSSLPINHPPPPPPPPPRPEPTRTLPSPQFIIPPPPPSSPSSSSLIKPTPIPNPLSKLFNQQDHHHHLQNLFLHHSSIPPSSPDDHHPHLASILQSTPHPQVPQHSYLPPPSSRLDPQELQSFHRLICSPDLISPSHSILSELCHRLFPSPSSSEPSHHPTLNFQKRSLATQPPHHVLLPRQALQGNGTGPSADGYPSCTAVSNAILSCFPQSHTVLLQHTWSKFIWNNNYPTFIGSRFVDIYLFNADSESPVANWTSIANDRGMIGIYADDSWFPPLTTWRNGRNLTYPYFFIITTAGSALTGAEQHQPTFTVVQTAPPPSYVSASIASVSASLAAARPSSVPSPTPNSALQSGSNGDSFPKWEIALIVILGTFALLIFLVAAYLAFTNARKRRQVRIWQAAALGTKSVSGGSVASHSPMIQNTEGAALMGNQKNHSHHHHPTGVIASSARELASPSSSRPGSPLSAINLPPIGHAFGLLSAPTDAHHHPPPPGSSEVIATPDGPITSVDATIMADAFRKALRKPEFSLPENVPEDSNDDGRRPQNQDHLTNSEDPLSQARMTPDGGDRNGLPDEDRTATGSYFNNVRESMHAQVLSVIDDPEPDHDPEAALSETDEAKEIMDRELASEGRSMTSVDNRKRPKVHG